MTGAHSRLLAWLAAAAIALAACSPAGSAAPGVTPVATTAAPAQETAAAQMAAAAPASSAPSAAEPPVAAPPPETPQPYAVNLFQEGDWVPQYTFDWCVAASIQMAHNLIDDTGGSTWADSGQQSALWERARALSANAYNGANPFGWAQVLTESGMGPYAVVSIATYDDAVRTAARALAETGRPVGLVMWSGRHAWVMSGFESVGDPQKFADFTVTGVNILDPLYPHGDTKWGPSPAPNSLLTPQELAAQFVIREPRRWSSDLEEGFLLVLPRDS
ncbi:hypothetical protein PSET11_01437 [Arthrobacter ulcerisalmonis]|uniref:Peptidase C39-like domain-containing protein n=1 Tax=Arthrobacter ulcerisalmonis TaxID=2483813 RepID=A0A3P5WT12_9MICC|nr:hypothetical protein [Arthrobacter ulcerisalmonis]VDC24765.1 hypothetical protein PSET11_01437 [Arthrobacter ulcerisalmonis]